MTPDVDLFGHEIRPQSPKARKKSGYAAPPGTGPSGETCKTCNHYTLREFANTYRKCGLMCGIWTRGPGTDILARSPACKKWERRNESE
jgi:hypothetical protein